MTSASPPAVATPGRFADLYTFQWNELHFHNAAVASVAVALSLIGGVLAGHPAAGLITGGGALTVGFGLNQQISDSRLWPMIAATLAMFFSTFVGMWVGHHGYGVVVAGAIWAFVYGMMAVGSGAGVAWVAQQAAVFLLVTSAFPASARDAFHRALLTLLGGALQIVFTSLFFALVPELKARLMELPGYTFAQLQQFRHVLSWLRVWRRLRGFPRALPRLRTSPSVGFATRMAITVALAAEVYRRYGVQSGYWIPMTALLVQKPAFAETFNRALLRIAGTLAGAVLSTVVLLHLHPGLLTLAVTAAFFAFWAFVTNAVNYGLFAACLTSYIVFLLSLNATPGPEIAHRRAYATIVGGLIALCIHVDALHRHKQDPSVP